MAGHSSIMTQQADEATANVAGLGFCSATKPPAAWTVSPRQRFYRPSISCLEGGPLSSLPTGSRPQPSVIRSATLNCPSLAPACVQSCHVMCKVALASNGQLCQPSAHHGDALAKQGLASRCMLTGRLAAHAQQQLLLTASGSSISDDMLFCLKMEAMSRVSMCCRLWCWRRDRLWRLARIASWCRRAGCILACGHKPPWTTHICFRKRDS